MDIVGVIDRKHDRSTVDPLATGQETYPNFAFLVHSRATLLQDLPPKVDTAMTARQKRRRTRYAYSSLPCTLRAIRDAHILILCNSPEDHAILEAAYQENSKPDKSERVEIVKRVTLSEKEVQVRGAFGETRKKKY
jgi:hypothetical protein